jgi:tartrate dehydratase beta subunit/fumarate hydratase class I family protein
MRISTYSDLHLEFGSGWTLPPAVSGDVMILAGDIVTLRDYEPLDQTLRKWKKPALYATRKPPILHAKSNERRGQKIQTVAHNQTSARETAA